VIVGGGVGVSTGVSVSGGRQRLRKGSKNSPGTHVGDGVSVGVRETNLRVAVEVGGSVAVG
jgi:hypothetical protein